MITWVNETGDPGGLWALCLSLLLVVIAAWHMRQYRLAASALAGAAGLAAWACYHRPVYYYGGFGHFQRSTASVALMLTWAGLVWLPIALAHWDARRAAHPGGTEAHSPQCHLWGRSELTVICGALSLFTLLLICYHLAAPLALAVGGFRATNALCTLCAGGVAVALGLIVHRAWSQQLADLTLGMATLALCGLMQLMVPEQPARLAERYPMIFNAMIVGLAAATAGWTGLYLQLAKDAGQGGWATPAARHTAGRFAYIAALLALVVSTVMAVWPRLPGIVTSDDSLGRMASGVAAHLVLLAVVLWSARRLRRLTLHLAGGVAALLLLMFVVLRMLPFTPAYG